MLCTAEEIAEKRRIALERLKNRKLNGNAAGPSTPSPAEMQPQTSSSSLSAVQHNLSNEATSPKSIASFYGKETNLKTNRLSAYESKIKSSSTPKTHNRILSQPYHNNSNDSRGHSIPTKEKLAPVFTKVVSCSCSMVTPRRFQVVSSSYCAKLIDTFKTIPSRSYGMRRRLFGL